MVLSIIKDKQRRLTEVRTQSIKNHVIMRLCSLEVNKIAEITVPSDEPYQENESNQITKECQGQHM